MTKGYLESKSPYLFQALMYRKSSAGAGSFGMYKRKKASESSDGCRLEDGSRRQE